MDIMDKMDFKYRLNEINKNYEQLISIKNTPLLRNGIFLRYKICVNGSSYSSILAV